MLRNRANCLAMSLLLFAAAHACLPGCNSSLPAESIPEHFEFQIDSTVLKESRRINVLVPELQKSGSASLPVLYMLDGGVLEDFPHIASTVKSLIEKGEISPLILVGIENTDRKRDLTGPTSVEADKEIAPVVGGSASFRAFIRDELMPEIDRRFQCDGQTAIVGESLAGLFVMETFLTEPSTFDRYIAMDPSLWWNGQELVSSSPERLMLHDTSNRKLWFASSREPDIEPHARKLAETLRTAAPATLEWTYEPRPDEEHSTIFRATKESAFRWTLWKSSPDLIQQQASDSAAAK